MPSHSPIGRCCAAPRFKFAAGVDDRAILHAGASWTRTARAVRETLVRAGRAFVLAPQGDRPHVRNLGPDILRDLGLPRCDPNCEAVAGRRWRDFPLP